MERTFTNFLAALRGADVRISVAETLDAMETFELIGFNERETLKDALGMALAKTGGEKEVFDHTFDRFFKFESFKGGGETREGSGPNDLDPNLKRMLEEQDRAGLALAMQEAAKQINVENIRFFTQRGLYTQRILQAMGIEEVDAAIAAQGGAGGQPGGGGGQGQAEGQGQGQGLSESRAWLFEQVRDFVEQQLSLQGAGASAQLREDRLRRSRLGNLDRRDQEQMRKIVEKIAQRLVALHSRRRKLKNRGVLDIRRTMRRNYGSDGVLFEIEWKKRKIDKPRVIAICDVSGSVASVARFLLQFLYELHELLHHIQTFAFSGRLIETSSFFKDKKPDDAVNAIMDKVGYMSTDYGEAFRNFRSGWLNDIDKKTAVIILGDGRSNFTNPETGILKEIHDRCKRLIWLNPEPPPLWGTGDSEMRRYTPYCDLVRECNTLNHLERVVGDLLQIAARSS